MTPPQQGPGAGPGVRIPSVTGAADKPILKPAINLERGVSGTAIFGGQITTGEYVPTLTGAQGLAAFDKMRRSDAQVRATLQVMKLPLLAATWQAIPPAGGDLVDEQIAEAVNLNLFDDDGMTDSWQFVLKHILLMCEFGFSILEKRWRVDGEGTYYIERLAPRLPQTIHAWHVNRDGSLVRVWQYAPVIKPDTAPFSLDPRRPPQPPQAQFEYLPIPGDAVCVFTFDREGDNFEGCALALDTPVPSPHGWRTMGDLAVGDCVFEASGAPTRVVAVKRWTDRPCYRLTFDDGDTIIADANHRWLTQNVSERSGQTGKGLGTIRTTAQLAARIVNTNGVTEHTIALAGPLQFPEQSLPVDPYVLGYWLGNGTHDSSQIATHVADAAEIAALIRARGFTTVTSGHNGRKGALGTRLGIHGLVTALKPLGVVGHKHVPESYLCASVAQRTALLQGLMDSDGSVNTRNRVCEFINTNAALADAVVWLVRSLGGKATIHQWNPPSQQGQGWQPKFYVRFAPVFQPFLLARKAAKAEALQAGQARAKHHYIVAVDPVAPRDTVCIEVAASSHLFLAGTACKQSSNSILRSSFRNWFYKDLIYHLDGVRLDRYGVGIPVAELEEGHALSDDDLDDLEDVLKDLRSNERVYLIAPPHVKYRILAPEGGGGASSSAGSLIDHHDMMISRNVLAGFLTMATDSSGFGSMTYGSRLTDLFLSSLYGVVAGIAAELKRSVVKPLCDLNWNMQEREYPSIVVRDLEANDVERTIGILLKAVGTLITPDDTLEEMLRKALKLSPLPEQLSRTAIAKKAETAAKAVPAAPAADPALAAGPAPGAPVPPGLPLPPADPDAAPDYAIVRQDSDLEKPWVLMAASGLQAGKFATHAAAVAAREALRGND